MRRMGKGRGRTTKRALSARGTKKRIDFWADWSSVGDVGEATTRQRRIDLGRVGPLFSSVRSFSLLRAEAVTAPFRSVSHS